MFKPKSLREAFLAEKTNEWGRSLKQTIRTVASETRAEALEIFAKKLSKALNIDYLKLRAYDLSSLAAIEGKEDQLMAKIKKLVQMSSNPPQMQ